MLTVDIAIEGKLEHIPEGALLGGVVDAARVNIMKSGMVITGFILDGVDLTREKEKEFREKPVENFTLLEVKAASPHELSLNTLNEIKPCLENLRQHHLRAAELVSAGNYRQSMTVLNECFAAWEDIIKGIKNVASVSKIDVIGQDFDGGRLTEKIGKLGEVLRNFQNAMATQDVVRMKDISEYEVQPLIADWNTVVDKLISAVAKKSEISAG